MQEEKERERMNHKSRRRKKSLWWDVAPRGFEHISPLQYKAMQGTRVQLLVQCFFAKDMVLNFFFDVGMGGVTTPDPNHTYF